jgi:hypothetical protein
MITLQPFVVPAHNPGQELLVSLANRGRGVACVALTTMTPSTDQSTGQCLAREINPPTACAALTSRSSCRQSDLGQCHARYRYRQANPLLSRIRCSGPCARANFLLQPRARH